MTIARSCLCGVLLVVAARDGTAQSFYGGLRGVVRDADGVAPGVELTLTNQETGVSRTTFSNPVGDYTFIAIVPGTYGLRATLAGYKILERNGLVIGTQESVTVDLVLEIGTVAQEITVSGATPVLNQANASIGHVLNRNALDMLPNHGRSAFVVATLMPTVISFGDPRFDRQQDQNNTSAIALGGGQARTNSFLFDGVPIATLLGAPSATPTLEALAEVKVQVHTYDAEMAHSGGGTFNATARPATSSRTFRSSMSNGARSAAVCRITYGPRRLSIAATC